MIQTPAKPSLFPLGEIVSTRGALMALEDARISALSLLERHVTGDWGDWML